MIPFVKYQGAGNDFVIVNHLEGAVLTDLSVANIARLCDRRFGIGGDGLMLLEPHPEFDFEMKYYNSDGRPSTMCGNGGRCLVAYAHRLGVITKKTIFHAVDGMHRAIVERPDWIQLEMVQVDIIEKVLDGCFLNTGSPHYLEWHEDLATIDVNTQGRTLRNNEVFSPGGTNVNFIHGDVNGLSIATYERGVEAETLACGTGVTAAAIVAVQRNGKPGQFTVPVLAKGGGLEVKVDYDGQVFSSWLCGPATFVFEGEISV